MACNRGATLDFTIGRSTYVATDVLDSRRVGALYQQGCDLTAAASITLPDDWDDWFAGIALIYSTSDACFSPCMLAPNWKRGRWSASIIDCCTRAWSSPPHPDERHRRSNRHHDPRHDQVGGVPYRGRPGSLGLWRESRRCPLSCHQATSRRGLSHRRRPGTAPPDGCNAGRRPGGAPCREVSQ
jgi:hypothetical protein